MSARRSSTLRRRTVALLPGLATLVLLAAPGAARAQGYDAPHTVRFGVAGGAIVPTSDARSALKTGVHGQAFMLVNVMPNFPLRFNLGYQRMNLKDALAAGQSGTSTSGGSSSMLSGVAGTQIDLFRGPLRPYLVAGIGGFDVRNSVTGLSGQNTTDSQLRFGVDGGGGIALKLGRLSAFVEGRVQNVYTSAGGVIDTRNIRTVPVSFGLLF